MSTTNGSSHFTRPFAQPLSSVSANKKQPLPVLYFLFILAAVMNAGSAHAYILTKLQGTQAHVTNNVFQAEVTHVDCSNGQSLDFFYVQRMIINGKVEMVLTEFIYEVGTYDLLPFGECNGSTLYGLGSCACLTTAFTNAAPGNDMKIAATAKTEIAPKQLFLPEQHQLAGALDATGFLWIREGGKIDSML